MHREPTATEHRLIVEHSPVMIWRSGIDAKCNYFNATWLQFTGRSMEQEMGDGWAEGVHADDFQRCVACYLDHFGRREPFEMEYRLRRRDGVFRWIFDRGVPYCDESGEFAGFIGSCIDVDERRRSQAALQMHSDEQLALARDFEKWILAIVSHDIRGPLNTIQLSAAILSIVGEAGGAARKQADVIARSVRRIQTIVDDLLDLSREREGAGIRVQPRPADMGRLCRQIVEELKNAATHRDVGFDCAADGHGSWDEGRIMQALSNLASNAVEHGVPGSPIRIRLTGNEGQVQVAIHNEGVIPPETLPHIFEPFRSTRDHGVRGDGLGLGLFIASCIARAHGGSLQVESREGAGTTFVLALPRAPGPPLH